MIHCSLRHRNKMSFVVLIFICLCVSSSCKEKYNPVSMEEMQARMMVRIHCSEIFYPLDIDLDPDRQEFLPEQRVETYTYRGVEYKTAAYYVTGKEANEKPTYPVILFENSIYSHEKRCVFGGVAEDGSHFTIIYTDEWKLPLTLWNYEQPIYDEALENPNEDDLIEFCEEFVDEYINENADFELDFSKYTYVGETKIGSLIRRHTFERYVNGIMVHRVQIEFNENYQIIGYSISATPLEESIYELIPELNESEWSEVARPAIEKAYQSYPLDVGSIADLKTKKTLPNVSGYAEDNYDFQLYYDESISSYCVFYTLSLNIESADGEIETVTCRCSYPFYAVKQE